MMNISTRHESKRGCGFRKPGGIYLVAGAPSAPCGRLPIALDVCPTCHHGIKPSRGWTWIDIRPLLDPTFECPDGTVVAFTGTPTRRACICPLDPDRAPERIGLLWIGERYYPTPADFTAEGSAMGISRRVSAIPRDFKIGETWIAFAHQKTIDHECETCAGHGNVHAVDGVDLESCQDCDGNGRVVTPAIFGMFQPTAIEYVIRPDWVSDPEYIKKLESLEKRGFTLINVNRITDGNQTRIPVDDDQFDPDYEVGHDPACRCDECGANDAATATGMYDRDF